MLLTEKEMEVYNIEQCHEPELTKYKEFYNKLNIDHIMTFKGFYHIFWKELGVLNIDKIGSFSQLCKKFKNYHRFKRRINNRNRLYIK